MVEDLDDPAGPRVRGHLAEHVAHAGTCGDEHLAATLPYLLSAPGGEIVSLLGVMKLMSAHNSNDMK